MGEGITTYLLTQGVLGVVCTVLGFVCVKLYNRNEKLQLEKDVLQKEKQEIIEDRRLESVQTTKDMMEVLQLNSQNSALLAAKIEAVKNGERTK